MTYVVANIFSEFFSNYEASASELLENLAKVYTRYRNLLLGVFKGLWSNRYTVLQHRNRLSDLIGWIISCTFTEQTELIRIEITRYNKLLLCRKSVKCRTVSMLTLLGNTL